MKEFWESRAKRYGHTGWNDVLIYSYDQQARLLVIEQILKSLRYDESIALDFGAGVGDFSNLLSNYFQKVISFDISNNVIEIAKIKYGSNSNIEFVSKDHIEEVEIPNNSIDCILSVTVLDCILDDFELSTTINYFNSILKNNGILILFEYALDYEKPPASYQRFTKFNEWVSMLSTHNFHLCKCYNFYHPLEQPCNSYNLYRNNIKCYHERVLRLLAKCGLNQTVKEYLTNLARMYLEGKMDFFWEIDENNSPIKIMIYKKDGYPY